MNQTGEAHKNFNGNIIKGIKNLFGGSTNN